jgi:TolB-like protein
MDASDTHSLTLNGRSVDFAAHRVRDTAGGEIPLRAQSFAVLRHLIENAGRTVSKDELIAAVWGGIAVTDDSLVQCVRDVRRALGDEAQKVVRTVPRRGYRLDLPETQRAYPAARRRWLPRAAAALLLLAMFGAALVGAAFLRRSDPLASDLPALAVLPFDDMSADGGNAYFGEGVAEDIIAMLARSPDVRVVSRYSSFVYGGTPVDIRKIGTELGVGYVLEGSVRRDGNELRVVAQLNDARTGLNVWAESFDESGTDPMALQEAVAGKIIGALAGERGELRRRLFRAAWTRDATALGEYDYYLRGVDLMHSTFSAESNAEISSIINEGLAEFPESSLLKIMLAWTHWRSAYYFWSDDPPSDFAAAGSLAREALASPNPTLRVQLKTHWLLSYVNLREGNVLRALSEARRALDLAPHDPFMSAELAEIFIQTGQYDEALKLIATGEAGNPANDNFHRQLRGWILRLQGEPERSISEYAAAASDGPWLPLQEAISMMRLGRIDEARARVKVALAENPDMTRTLWRTSHFYSDPAILAGEIADLAAAGLPE